MISGTPLEAARRARFEALRQRVFGEMSQAHIRMKLVLVAPFNALVLAVLALRGYSAKRIVLQTALFFAWSALFAYQVSPLRVRRGTLALVLNLIIFSICLANTGGLASPFMPLVLSMVAGASVGLSNRLDRTVFFGAIGVTFLGLAATAHTEAGRLVPPLAFHDGSPSPEYVIIFLGSLVLTTLHLSQFGTWVKSAYERVAFELAARREELCSEGEDRTRALEGVAARLAHEVKNPLAAIKGLSAHMAGQATDPKMAERLSIVAGEADRLRDIVDGFLSFSRGLDELDVSRTRPYELARELTLLLETRAADASLTLEVTGSAEVEVNADVRKVRQILLNLVLNAMQASPPGQTVSMRVADSCSDGGFLRIQVKDSGAGMTPDVLERIRKPYFTTREGGTGLGVAVARGLVEQHGGQLSFESAPGKGTTVSIDLPRCALSAQRAQKQLPKPARSGTTQTCAVDFVSSAPVTPPARSVDEPIATVADGPQPTR